MTNITYKIWFALKDVDIITAENLQLKLQQEVALNQEVELSDLSYASKNNERASQYIFKFRARFSQDPNKDKKIALYIGQKIWEHFNEYRHILIQVEPEGTKYFDSLRESDFNKTNRKQIKLAEIQEKEIETKTESEQN